MFDNIRARDNDKIYTFNQYNTIQGNNINVGYIDTAMIIIPFNHLIYVKIYMKIYYYSFLQCFWPLVEGCLASGRVQGWRWCEGMGARGGFINIKDMYNNDVGKGGARVYEAYEVK